MSEDHPERSTEADADLQQEIRAERQFTLSEALGRLAGHGMIKGASPVSRKQQTEAEIQEYLRRHLADGGGVLAGVLLRRVKDSEVLLQDIDHPLVVLARYIRHILASEYELEELVREADVEWGRVLGERPSFEKDGCPPAPGDPYTRESVRAALTGLAGGLAPGEA